MSWSQQVSAGDIRRLYQFYVVLACHLSPSLLCQLEEIPALKLIYMWRFPEIVVPLNHPFIDGFSIKTIHFGYLMVPPFMETYGNPHTCMNMNMVIDI